MPNMLPHELIAFIDLTSLNDNDQWHDIESLAHRATTDFGPVAALCIWPKFVEQLAQLNTHQELAIATVINFPLGLDSPDVCLKQAERAIIQGANEIDLVIPYSDLIKGDSKRVADVVRAGKEACKNTAKLKVIIESGELVTERNIKIASEISIENGCDFIKTSTGKVPINATLDAARYMLETIKTSNLDIGFKASGGIGNYAQAIEYVNLAKNMFGHDWLTNKHFRFGASSLLNSLLSPNKAGQIAKEGDY
ncbi:deoxyribose-phosphate aldolase [Psychrosphaera sp. B3R10]|uniref:deoxyribose-phosphate aldolase n=1 Tax=unclassified Psychrosphaera TaxID=2641570 RepID=UPI001C09CEC6|nr:MULTISPECIES: deoxyribose-phosphate aldolase [unclassified Psychrosphaera]MBU2881340.1 deoxyribose-phosphate aldolase [Psychrosphaera sp. I2R16]MBU2988439.1 deoxyribose-phosphate aldolase [Psychrosphaera sp. B3R10]MDO6720061.1 deoxyribose-phosphate aldolase [Psychrosphaera sp. 1_MG-2023]